MSPDLIERLEEAQKRIGWMCSELRPPRMSVPVQQDDDDVFITTALREAASVLSSQTWRPIESAPRDGRRVMVFPDHRFGGHGFTVAKYGSGHFGGMPGEARHLTGWISEGFFMGPQPTHWMPLPPPPVLSSLEGGEMASRASRAAMGPLPHVAPEAEPGPNTTPEERL